MAIACTLTVASILGLAAPEAQAIETVTISVAGVASIDLLNAAANSTQVVNLGAGAHVLGVGWDVSLSATSPSWLSEMRVALLDSSGLAGINLQPGIGSDRAGTGTYSSGGVVDLAGLGNDFFVGADGQLRLQFYEDFNDLVGADATWTAGALTVQYTVSAVPEPAAWVLSALGLTGLLLARRRQAQS